MILRFLRMSTAMDVVVGVVDEDGRGLLYGVWLGRLSRSATAGSWLQGLRHGQPRFLACNPHSWPIFFLFYFLAVHVGSVGTSVLISSAFYVKYVESSDRLQ